MAQNRQEHVRAAWRFQKIACSLAILLMMAMLFTQEGMSAEEIAPDDNPKKAITIETNKEFDWAAAAIGEVNPALAVASAYLIISRQPNVAQDVLPDPEQRDNLALNQRIVFGDDISINIPKALQKPGQVKLELLIKNAQGRFKTIQGEGSISRASVEGKRRLELVLSRELAKKLPGMPAPEHKGNDIPLQNKILLERVDIGPRPSKFNVQRAAKPIASIVLVYEAINFVARWKSFSETDTHIHTLKDFLNNDGPIVPNSEIDTKHLIEEDVAVTSKLNGEPLVDQFGRYIKDRN